MNKQLRFKSWLVELFEVYLSAHFLVSLFSYRIPHRVKMATLVRHSPKDAAWIETGTYLAKTTAYLAKRYPQVISIEPASLFYDYAGAVTKKYSNILLLKGSSEERFSEAITIPKAKNLSCWLDGHYSAGSTFYGKKTNPLDEELATIFENQARYEAITICIDDINNLYDIGSRDMDYPDITDLVLSLRKNGFNWIIENNILIAKNY